MNGNCVVVGITGGIAAYKSAEIVSRLTKAGFEVHVIMTKNATQFIAPLTLETLSCNPVTTDTFLRDRPWEVEHVALARKADLLVVAPATANVIAKLALGIADDMLTTTALATTAPMLIAPAMHDHMYEHVATQENIAVLRARGCLFVGPGTGNLASGDVGIGRMSEPVEIVEEIVRVLGVKRSLQGKRLLVTAGPTRESLDPVRYITNRSSGRMGYAIAIAAARRGAQVTLVSGPVNLPRPTGVELIAVETTQQMHDAALNVFPGCDAAILAAAPADYRPAEAAPQKLKKQGGQGLTLDLVQTPDIAAALGGIKTTAQRLVIFAAETGNLVEYASGKLARKGADLAVANDVTQEGAGFDVDTNRVTLVSAEGYEELPLMSKMEVAGAILNRLEKLF